MPSLWVTCFLVWTGDVSIHSKRGGHPTSTTAACDVAVAGFKRMWVEKNGARCSSPRAQLFAAMPPGAAAGVRRSASTATRTAFVTLLVLLVLLGAALTAVRARVLALRLQFLRDAPVPLRAVQAALRTGDIVLCSHDVHAGAYARLGRFGADAASFVTLHVGVVWVSPQLGGRACIVEAVNGTSVGPAAEWLGDVPSGVCVDCAYDELTRGAFVQGVRVVPLDRFLACYGGAVAVRHLDARVQPDAGALERVLMSWALHQPFSRCFDRKSGPRFLGAAAQLVLGTTLGLDRRVRLEDDGVLCSDVVAVLLCAAGVWTLSEAPFDGGRGSAPPWLRALNAGAPHRAIVLRHAAAAISDGDASRAARLHRGATASSMRVPQHVPVHFSSRGTPLARSLWGPEIRVCADVDSHVQEAQ